MGFPTFYLSDLILIDANNNDYQCKVNWSPWTREECRSYVIENNQKYGSFKNASQEFGCVDNSLFRNFCLSPVLPLERTYWSVVLLICFILPIIVLIGSYAGLVLQIVRVQRNIKNMGNSSGKNKSRQTDDVKLTVTLFCVGFIVCWGPSLFFRILQVTGLVKLLAPDEIGQTDYCEAISQVASTMEFVFPVANAILYSFMGPRFQKDLLRFFGRLKDKHPSVTSTVFTSTTGVSQLSRKGSRIGESRIQQTKMNTLEGSTSDEKRELLLENKT